MLYMYAYNIAPLLSSPVVLATHPKAETNSLLRLLSMLLSKVGVRRGSVETQRGGQSGGRGAAILRRTMLRGDVIETVPMGRVGTVWKGNGGRPEAHGRAA